MAAEPAPFLPADQPDWLPTAFDLVAGEGPIAVDQLVALLADDGIDVDEKVLLDELCFEGCEVVGDRVVSTDDLLEGVELTHRLTEEELALGAVLVEPDWSLLSVGFKPRMQLDDGGRLRHISARAAGFTGVPASAAALAGPEGWLAPYRSGQLVALAWGPVLTLDAVDELDVCDDARIPRRLAEAFAEVPLGTMLTWELVAMVALDDPLAFSLPRRPVTELLAGAGLSTFGDLVGPAGWDWRAMCEAPDAPILERLAADHPDGDEAGAAMSGLLRAVGRFDLGFPLTVDDLRLAAAGLRDAVATDLLLGPVSNMAKNPVVVVPLMHRFAVTVGEAAETVPAGAHVVMARCAEMAGAVDDHEAHIERALAADPAFRPALQDAWWLAYERGDAGRAVALGRAMGKEMMRADGIRLEQLYAAAGPIRVAGHVPCPCGSGKRHRACCRLTNGWALSQRAVWLLDKLCRWVVRMPQWPAVKELAEVFRTVAEDDEDALVLATCGARLLQQLALFEQGLLVKYRAQRGHRLPEDEARLVDAWVGARHRAWTVVSHDGPRWARMRDDDLGHELDILCAERQPAVGAHAFGLAVPVADQHLVVGGLLDVPEPFLPDLIAAVRTGRAEAILDAMAGPLVLAALQDRAHG